MQIRRTGWMRGLFATLPTILAVWSVFAGRPSVAQEISTSVTGTLDVFIEEHFDAQRSRMAYFLRDDARGRVYELRFDRPERRPLKTGQRVSVKGRASGRILAVDELSVTGTDAGAAGAQDAAALTERRTVVLMVDMADARASSRYTLSQVATGMYTGTRNVDDLYRTASFGQLGFESDTDGNGSPDVFGPFQVSHSAAANCNYYDWATATETAAQAAGIDLSRYQHRVFILPHYQYLTQCTWAGVANVGCGTFCRAWIAEAESPMVIAHELGHNLNMAHAGTDPENDGTINVVYGDSSDPMGSSRSWHIFTPAHADQSGWYSEFQGSVATVTASGTFDIVAAGTHPAYTTMPQALRIRKPDSGDYYYVSFRQPAGYDDTLSSTYTQGVSIHRYAGTGYNPTSFIRSLPDGGTFTDVANGIAVAQVTHGSGFATVTITVPGGSSCTAATPAVTVSPAAQVVQPGHPVSFAVNVSNRDGASCPATTFGLAYSGTLTGTLSPGSFIAAAGQTVSSTLTVPGSDTDGNHTVQVQATDTDGLVPAHSSVTAAATVTIDGVAPSAPSGLNATVGRPNRVNLAWYVSADAGSGVGSYMVYRNGTFVSQVSGNTWSETLTVSGTYAYTVYAKDRAGNVSAPSNESRVTVSASKKKPTR